MENTRENTHHFPVLKINVNRTGIRVKVKRILKNWNPIGNTISGFNTCDIQNFSQYQLLKPTMTLHWFRERRDLKMWCFNP